MSNPEIGNVEVLVRRRRTRRHRRNRLIRRWLTAAMLSIIVASVSTFALQYFSLSLFSDRQSAPSTQEPSELTLSRPSAINQILSDAQPSRPVYPYSVVAGGVEDAKELKWVAEHDPIVGATLFSDHLARRR